jgi:hypothetical protein
MADRLGARKAGCLGGKRAALKDYSMAEPMVVHSAETTVAKMAAGMARR